MSVVVLPFLLVWGLIVGSIVGKLAKAKRQAPPKAGPTPAEERIHRSSGTGEKPARRPINAGEGHIPRVGLPAEARLEQWETLWKAGLLTREEYDRKRRDILGAQ